MPRQASRLSPHAHIMAASTAGRQQSAEQKGSAGVQHPKSPPLCNLQSAEHLSQGHHAGSAEVSGSEASANTTS